eukprot:8605121-Alexandrium_andersonii.AAC.1
METSMKLAGTVCHQTGPTSRDAGQLELAVQARGAHARIRKEVSLAGCQLPETGPLLPGPKLTSTPPTSKTVPGKAAAAALCFRAPPEQLPAHTRWLALSVRTDISIRACGPSSSHAVNEGGRGARSPEMICLG